MVTMRDGVRLATDVYVRPQRHAGRKRYPGHPRAHAVRQDGPEPLRAHAANPTPLGRAEVAAFFVERGYVVVYQDCRGRYKSEGEFVKYLSDGNDGYDTCAWIVKQPWCNGRIGDHGPVVRRAHARRARQRSVRPGVAAMFLDSGGFSNAYQGGIRQGGAFELKQATWAFNQALESPEIAATIPRSSRR